MADAEQLSPSGEMIAPPAYLEWLRPLDRAAPLRLVHAKRVGGKAESIARLVRAGFKVPRAWVIEAKHFTQCVESLLPKGHDAASIIRLAGTRAGIDKAARARDRLLGCQLPSGLTHALDVYWRELHSQAPWGIAVRSSATCEDQEETSLAGIATTVLGVRGPEGLENAVRQVWASVFLPRAIDYLAHSNIRDVSMAVVLQLMVQAEAAGVLFTAPPTGLSGDHWRENERLINVTWGLGAPVVDGAMTADSFRLAKAGGALVASVIANKSRALEVGPEGLRERLVPETQANRPALTPAVLLQLGSLAERLEQELGGPLDLEFAVEAPTSGTTGPGERKLWLLQARPAKGRDYPEGGNAETVWSRANVGEALPGAATPLTWSIARSFSDRGFREAFAALGCRVPKGACLVNNVHGRFYLNLTAFMQISAQVPGLTPKFLLGVSGGANEAAIALLEKQARPVSKRSFFLRLPLTVPRVLVRQALLDREVAAYDRDATAAQRSFTEMDLRLLPDDGLATTLKSTYRLLEKTGSLMLHCASASLASHLGLSRALEKLAARGASPRDGGQVATSRPGIVEHLTQTLEGGIREVDSACPGVALARVAEAFAGDPEMRRAILDGSVRTLGDIHDSAAKEALLKFLSDFGDRAVREAELATPRWSEDPSAVIAMLVSGLRGPSADPEKALTRARAQADREMALLEARLSAPEMGLIRLLVARSHHFTRLREKMRTWVTRVLGMLRTIALDADRRLRRMDGSLSPGSVFFCTYDELLAALASGTAEVGSVVRLRRAQHVRDAARPDPPATFVGRPAPITLPPVDGPSLAGLPASGGVVEGRARVLGAGSIGLDTLLPGEILVSRTTDVGLSPLFLVAAAVVTELGGPLSHAAVVAREYGIPAVVNVSGVTCALRTGDRIRVDGDRGLIEILESETTRAAPPLATS